MGTNSLFGGKQCTYVPPEPSLYVIDPDGDLHLKVGTGKCYADESQLPKESLSLDCDSEHGHHHAFPIIFLVCSKALSRASPVWKTLLYGKFVESKPSDPLAKWTVELPADDTMAMFTILNIVHGRFECLYPSSPDFGVKRVVDLFNLAVLTDKYDLSRLLRPWISTWMQLPRDSFTKPPTPFSRVDNGHLLWIAWEMGDEGLFEKTARSVIVNHTISKKPGMFGYIPTPFGDVFAFRPEPLELRDYMESTRLERIAALLQPYHDLLQGLTSVPYAKCYCDSGDEDTSDCHSSILGNLIRSLAEAGLWPLPEPANVEKSVVQFTNDLKNIRTYSLVHQCNALSDSSFHEKASVEDVQLQLRPIHTEHLARQAAKTGL
ncbi:hypothetical protein F5Y16DRAFT_389728 [Xylariaceae sp. FL0255]|nr:hypothetical protein F5Y16DRAFT_389728 [Xylariaceae sp. FL0255]